MNNLIRIAVALGSIWCSPSTAYAQEPTCTDTTPVITLVEKMPEYPGGNDALFRFLREAVSVPASEAMDGIPASRATFAFTVQRDGSICDIVATHPDQQWVARTEAALRGMPHWQPGEQRGSAVNVRYSLPMRIHIK